MTNFLTEADMDAFKKKIRSVAQHFLHQDVRRCVLALRRRPRTGDELAAFPGRGEAERGSPHVVPMRERKTHRSCPNTLQGHQHLTFLPGNQAIPHLGGLGSRRGRWRVGGPEAGVGWESSRPRWLPAWGRAGTGYHPQPALERVRVVEWLALHARAEQGGRDGAVHVPAGCSSPGLRPEQRRRDG